MMETNSPTTQQQQQIGEATQPTTAPRTSTGVVTGVYGAGESGCTTIADGEGRKPYIQPQCLASLPEMKDLKQIRQDEWSGTKYATKDRSTIAPWIKALGDHMFPEGVIPLTQQIAQQEEEQLEDPMTKSSLYAFGSSGIFNYYGTCLIRYCSVSRERANDILFRNMQQDKEEERTENDCVYEPVAIMVLSSRPLADLWKPLLRTLDNMMPSDTDCEEIKAKWLPLLHEAIVNPACLGAATGDTCRCFPATGATENSCKISKFISTGETCPNPHVICLDDKEFMIPPLRPHDWECPQYGWKCGRCEQRFPATVLHQSRIAPRSTTTKKCVHCTAKRNDILLPEEGTNFQWLKSLIHDDRSVCADLLNGSGDVQIPESPSATKFYMSMTTVERKYFQFMFCKSGNPRTTLPRSDADHSALFSRLDPYKLIQVYNAILVGKTVLVICDDINNAYDYVMTLSTLVWPLKPTVPGVVLLRGTSWEVCFERNLISCLPRSRLERTNICSGIGTSEVAVGGTKDLSESSPEEIYGYVAGERARGRESSEIFIVDVERNEVSLGALDSDVLLASRHSMFLYERICRDCPLFPHCVPKAVLPPHPPLLHSGANPRGIKHYIFEKIEHVGMLFRDWPLRIFKREVLNSWGHDNLRKRSEDLTNFAKENDYTVKGWELKSEDHYYDFAASENMLRLPSVSDPEEFQSLCTIFFESPMEIGCKMFKMSEELSNSREGRAGSVSYSKGVARAIDSDDEMFDSFEVPAFDCFHCRVMSPWELWRKQQSLVNDAQTQINMEHRWQTFRDSHPDLDMDPNCPFTFPQTPTTSFISVRMAFVSVFVSLFKAFRFYVYLPREKLQAMDPSRTYKGDVASVVDTCGIKLSKSDTNLNKRCQDTGRSVSEGDVSPDLKTLKQDFETKGVPFDSNEQGVIEGGGVAGSPDSFSTGDYVLRQIGHFADTQSRYGDRALLRRAAKTQLFYEFCINRFEEEQPDNEIDRGGVDIFDDLCYAALVKRHERQSAVRDKAYRGFLYKAISGTKCKSPKYRFFILNDNVLLYFSVDKKLREELTKLDKLEGGPNAIWWENEIIKSRYRGRFELIPGETFVTVPRFTDEASNAMTRFPFQLSNNSTGEVLTLFATTSGHRVVWIEHINARLKCQPELTYKLYRGGRDDKVAQGLRAESKQGRSKSS